jgi:hypothetical protein
MDTPEDIKAYYQYVPFLLLIEALLFFTPKSFWMSIENYTMEAITLNLRGTIVSLEQHFGQCQKMVNFIKNQWSNFRSYFFCYMLFNCFNMINVLGQLYFINYFLGGVFLANGTDVFEWIEMPSATRNDPLVLVFPKIIKCTFYQYSVKNSLEKINSFCILPLNSFNEMIYITLWFWLVIVSALTLVYLMYIMCLFVIPPLRWLRMSGCRSQRKHQSNMNSIKKNANVGDWFMIYLIYKNVEPIMFQEFITRLAKTFKIGQSDKSDKKPFKVTTC